MTVDPRLNESGMRLKQTMRKACNHFNEVGGQILVAFGVGVLLIGRADLCNLFENALKAGVRVRLAGGCFDMRSAVSVV